MKNDFKLHLQTFRGRLGECFSFVKFVICTLYSEVTDTLLQKE